MDEIQHFLVSSRVRFVASLVGFGLLFTLTFSISDSWNGNLRFGLFLLHDLLLIALLGLRLRQMRMNEAWALLAFVPILGIIEAVYLLIRNEPAPERYSGF